MAYQVGSVVQQHIITPEERRALMAEEDARAQDQEIRTLTLQQAREQRQMQIDQMRREQEEQTYLRGAYQRFGGDEDAMIADAKQRNPDLGMRLEDRVLKRRTTLTEARIKDAQLEKLNMEADTALLNQMVDGTTFSAFKPRVSPALQKVLGDQYNPEVIEKLKPHGEAEKDRLDRIVKLIGKNPRETLLDDLAGADTPEEWAATWQGYQGLGLKPQEIEAFQQMFGKDFTPEGLAAVRAKIAQTQKAPGAGSDYAQFLSRWATEHGTTPDKLTATQELAARKAYGQADDAARRPIVPIVIPTAQGPQLLDRTTGVARPVFDQHGNVIAQAPTAEMRNRGAVRDMATKSVDAVRALSQKVITKRGVAQRAQAAGRSIQSALGNDPEYKTYQDARLGLAGNLAVLQQGSRPSDADIKAIWLPLVPDVFSDTDQSAAMKWGLIYTMSGLEPPDKRGGTPKLSAEELLKKYGGK